MIPGSTTGARIAQVPMLPLVVKRSIVQITDTPPITPITVGDLEGRVERGLFLAKSNGMACVTACTEGFDVIEAAIGVRLADAYLQGSSAWL